MSEDTQEGTSEEENQDQESDTQEGTSEDSEEEQDQENTQHFIDESQEFSEFDSHSSGRIIAPVLEAQAIPISSLEQTTGFTPGSSATSDSSSDSLYNPGNQEKGFSQYEQDRRRHYEKSNDRH